MRLPRPASRETVSLSSTGHSPGPRLPLARRAGTAVREECADRPRRLRDGLADAVNAAMRAGMAAKEMVADHGAMPSMRKQWRWADERSRRRSTHRDVPSGVPAPSPAAHRCPLQRPRYPRVGHTDIPVDAELPPRRNPETAPRWTKVATAWPGDRQTAADVRRAARPRAW